MIDHDLDIKNDGTVEIKITYAAYVESVMKSSELDALSTPESLYLKELRRAKLDTILEKNNILPEEYNHWVIDLQGSELLFFKGATNALKSCNSISVEVSKVKYYEGGVLWNELVNWLNEKNFYSTTSPEKNHTEILFKKK